MDHSDKICAGDRERLIGRFAPAAAHAPVLPGDHALNPGTRPKEPLTPAAVMIPIIARPQGLTLLFTRRTEHLAVHAGQISFPGGHVEPADNNPEETALRECEEEIGLDRKHVTVLGNPGGYVTRTGFHVTPVAGLIEPPFELNIDPHEVAEAFEAPLDFFLDPANHRQCNREFEGTMRKFYAIPYGDRYIWGATAGILINFYNFMVR
ncbi:MAG: hypothetical protein A3G18_08975 [Rhodospirillales bacterium RIFCSPLOWO2_12_FULL_58_28]|nr:MAG: hypothetical protein A3H92_01570 [Rhodospirillales bacterium RIFCSPLOWO2_02_FULL_58_16]OHC78435.1 MAG: hypothetical protein A3G18_08975 [Rhodospirillales bacterium RIFCSPLOWO2_12_FULL_58_28]